MKLFKPVLAFSFSLTIFACSQGPTSISEAPVYTQTLSHHVLAKPESEFSATQVKLHKFAQTERLSFQFKFSNPLGILAAPSDKLAFVKVTLRGADLEAPLVNDAVEGSAFLALEDGEVSGSLSNIPIKPGAVRVLTMQGYDADKQPLTAFEAKGFYRSQSGQSTHALAINRRQLLTGRILDEFLNLQSARLDTLDLEALQDLVDETLGYSPTGKRFKYDPLRFSASAIILLLAKDAEALPDAQDLIDNALLNSFSVPINIHLTEKGALSEDLVLSVNDPSSQTVNIPKGTAAPMVIPVENILPGRWEVSISKLSDASVLAETTLEIKENGNITLAQGFESKPFELENLAILSGETLINSYTSNHQALPALAMDDTGKFVAVWQSTLQDGSGLGIYGQLFNAAATPEGSEFLINSQTALNQEEAEIAMDSNGDFVVVWQSENQDGNGMGIYAQLYSASGNKVGEEFRVNQATAGNQKLPSVAMDNGGNFVVAWEAAGDEETEDGTEIYARRFDASGNALDDEFLVNEDTTGNQSHPQAAMDGDGDFVIAWESSGQDGDSTGVYFQRFNKSGNSLASAVQANSQTSGAQDNPHVSMNNTGEFVVTWASDNQDGNGDGVYAKRYDISGNPLTAEFLVNTSTSGFQNNPRVSLADNGSFVIAFTDLSGLDQDGSGIFAQRYNANNEKIGQEQQINAHTLGFQANSRVAHDSAGRYFILWQDTSGRDGQLSGVYGQLFDANGLPN